MLLLHKEKTKSWRKQKGEVFYQYTTGLSLFLAGQENGKRLEKMSRKLQLV